MRENGGKYVAAKVLYVFLYTFTFKNALWLARLMVGTHFFAWHPEPSICLPQQIDQLWRHLLTASEHT